MEIIKLNVIPSGVPSICHASQYDNGREYRALLFNDTLPYTLDGEETLTLEVRKPDDTIITAEIPNTTDNYVDFTTTEQMTAVVGINLCKIRIAKGEVSIATLIFYMEVQRDVLSDGIPSESSIHDLQARIDAGLAENDLFNSKMDKNNPTGTGSLAVGYNAVASGNNSLAVGYNVTASGSYSQALGDGARATGLMSLATCSGSASGRYSSAFGYGTFSNHRSQFVFGEYNIADPSTASATDRGTYVEIVGNGTKGFASPTRSNARTLDWQGNETLAGDLVFNGSTSLTQTLGEINNIIQSLRQATGV